MRRLALLGWQSASWLQRAAPAAAAATASAAQPKRHPPQAPVGPCEWLPPAHIRPVHSSVPARQAGGGGGDAGERQQRGAAGVGLDGVEAEQALEQQQQQQQPDANTSKQQAEPPGPTYKVSEAPTGEAHSPAEAASSDSNTSGASSTRAGASSASTTASASSASGSESSGGASGSGRSGSASGGASGSASGSASASDAAGGDKAGGAASGSGSGSGEGEGGQGEGEGEGGGDDDYAGDPMEDLEFFAVTQRRGLMLEDYTRRALLSGGPDATHRHLASRQPALAPVMHSVAAFLLSPVRALTQIGAERLVRAAFESEFDTRAFLEGAKGAVVEVMRRYGDKEWGELAGMVSERVLGEMKAAHEELRERRGLVVKGISVDVLGASLQMTCAWGRRSVAQADPARAACELPPGTVPFWHLVFVDVITDVRVRLEVAAGGGAGAARPSLNRTRRQGVFVFARGPLRRSAVPEVHAPWWVIGWL